MAHPSESQDPNEQWEELKRDLQEALSALPKPTGKDERFAIFIATMDRYKEAVGAGEYAERMRRHVGPRRQKIWKRLRRETE